MGQISQRQLEELKRVEAVRTQVYDDLTGKTVSSYSQVQGAPTIAVGRKIQDNEKDFFSKYLGGRQHLTGAALEKVIRDTIEPREVLLTKALKVPVTQSMFDALFSFAYNTGFYSKSFKKVLDRVNAGDFAGAQQAIADGPTTSKGKTLAGLVTRRAYEAALFAEEGLAPYPDMPLAGPDVDLGYAELGQTSGKRKLSPGEAVGVVVIYAIGGGISMAIPGALIGGVAPQLTWKQGAKYGAILGATLGALEGAVAWAAVKAVD